MTLDVSLFQYKIVEVKGPGDSLSTFYTRAII